MFKLNLLKLGFLFLILSFLLTNQVTIEESKQADRTTGQATHRISRGIHDKVNLGNELNSYILFYNELVLQLILVVQGHSVTRKLEPDGKVDTVQTLHNLDEG